MYTVIYKCKNINNVEILNKIIIIWNLLNILLSIICLWITFNYHINTFLFELLSKCCNYCFSSYIFKTFCNKIEKPFEGKEQRFIKILCFTLCIGWILFLVSLISIICIVIMYNDQLRLKMNFVQNFYF